MRHLTALGAVKLTRPYHLLKLPLQPDNTILQEPAVGLDLGFARTTHKARAAALSLDQGLLAELLGRAELRELLDPEVLAEVESELQWLADDRRARNAEGVADLLRLVGPLSTEEIRERAVALCQASRTDPPGRSTRRSSSSPASRSGQMTTVFTDTTWSTDPSASPVAAAVPVRSAAVGALLCVAGAATLASVGWGLEGPGLYCVTLMLAALVGGRLLATDRQVPAQRVCAASLPASTR